MVDCMTVMRPWSAVGGTVGTLVYYTVECTMYMKVVGRHAVNVIRRSQRHQRVVSETQRTDRQLVTRP